MELEEAVWGQYRHGDARAWQPRRTHTTRRWHSLFSLVMSTHGGEGAEEEIRSLSLDVLADDAGGRAAEGAAPEGVRHGHLVTVGFGGLHGERESLRRR